MNSNRPDSGELLIDTQKMEVTLVDSARPYLTLVIDSETRSIIARGVHTVCNRRSVKQVIQRALEARIPDADGS